MINGHKHHKSQPDIRCLLIEVYTTTYGAVQQKQNHGEPTDKKTRDFSNNGNVRILWILIQTNLNQHEKLDRLASAIKDLF